MRIVFVSLTYPTPWQPTAGSFNRAMVEALARDHQVIVVAPVPWTQRLRKPQQPVSAASAGGIEVHHPTYFYPPGMLRTHYGRFLWASCRKTLLRVAASFSPDAYLGYWTHPDGDAALRIARRTGRPCTVIAGGSDVLVLGRQYARRREMRRVLQSADAVLTVGDSLRKSVVDLGVPSERVFSFRRGVDATLFNPGESGAARARLGLAADVKAVLWVGRMVPVKGLDVLLDAWSQLADGAARLWLVGAGPLEPSLRRRADRLCLGARVTFAGARPQSSLQDWYRAADLTVLPSLSEGMPNVLLESLACGRPFVASDVGGVRELAAAGGALVRPNDASALAEAIAKELREPRHAALPKDFTWEACAATVTRVLTQTLRGASRAAS